MILPGKDAGIGMLGCERSVEGGARRRVGVGRAEQFGWGD